MIKITKLNKVYNKNKGNQVNAIVDCNIEFPEKGLVCFLGPSGCGKTSLLNVIGGLDKPTSGIINIDGVEIKKYKSKKWDRFRASQYGYIFQNYNLIEKETVYENLDFVLRMNQLTKEEREERIMYALKAVNLERFYKRKVRQLSGGQQQRVAIARAIIKNPRIIIADEPTGNLDESNTNQIMNIIRNISKNILVLLVTHEERLAKVYADRIIRIKDGKIISDVENVTTDSYVVADDPNIYLDEFTLNKYNESNLEISYFFKEDCPKLDLNVYYRNGKFYISSVQDINVLTGKSEIKVVNGKRPVYDKNNEQFSFNLKQINAKEKSSITTKDCIREAFFNFIKMSKVKKAFLLSIMTLASLFVAFSFSLYFGLENINPNLYRAINPNYVEVNNSNTYCSNEYLEENEFKRENVLNKITDKNAILLDSGTYILVIEEKTFTNAEHFTIDTSIELISNIEKSDIIAGRLPQNKNEIVIDKDFYADDTLGHCRLNEFEFLKRSTCYFRGCQTEELEIVGVVDKGFSTVYIDEDLYVNVGLMNLGFTINETFTGNQVYIGTSDITTAKTISSNSEIFKDVEFVMSESTSPSSSQVSDEYARTFLNNMICCNAFYYVCTSNKTKTVSEIESIEGYLAYDADLVSKEIFYFTISTLIGVYTTIAIILLVCVSIFLLLISRTNLISRIKEIGIYRSLGVRKRDILKMFVFESIQVSIITGIIGTLCGLGLVNAFSNMSSYIFVDTRYYVGFSSTLFFIIYCCITSLIPIFFMLKKTPSEIIAKYDI